MNTEILPLVSIIVPVYNHEQYVKYCLESIIAQTYKNIELFIIDDGSKDNSYSVVELLKKEFQNRFVNFYCEKHEKNQGLCNTLNEIIPKTSGKYIAIFASDDFMFPQRIEKQVVLMESQREKNIAFCHSNFICMNENNNHCNNNIPLIFLDIQSRNSIVEKVRVFLQTAWYFNAPTFLWDANILKSLGAYNPKIILEDFYMVIESIKQGNNFVYSTECLVGYRQHAQNTVRVHFHKYVSDYLLIIQDFELWCKENNLFIDYYNHISKFIGGSFYDLPFATWVTYKTTIKKIYFLECFNVKRYIVILYNCIIKILRKKLPQLYLFLKVIKNHKESQP